MKSPEICISEFKHAMNATIKRIEATKKLIRRCQILGKLDEGLYQAYIDRILSFQNQVIEKYVIAKQFLNSDDELLVQYGHFCENVKNLISQSYKEAEKLKTEIKI